MFPNNHIRQAILRKLFTLKAGPDGGLWLTALGLRLSASKVEANRNSLKKISVIMISLSMLLAGIGVLGGLSIIALIYDAATVSLLWLWLAVFLAAEWMGRIK